MMRVKQQLHFLCWLVLAVGMVDSSVVAQQQTSAAFELQGRVLTASGDPVQHSVVVPLSKSGFPTNAETGAILTLQETSLFNDESGFQFAQTDEAGNFSVKLVAGEFRLVAISWLDAEQPITNPLDRNGSRIRLDGVFSIDIQNEMEAAEPVIIQPIGEANVRLSSQEASDLLIVLSLIHISEPTRPY